MKDKRIKTAVILAAGYGSRLKKYTNEVPTGFVEVGGKPIIVRSIETLLSCGIERIIIVTGYRNENYEALAQDYPMLEFSFNPYFIVMQSSFSLYSCRKLVGDDDFLLLEVGLIYNKNAIIELLSSNKPDVALITDITKKNGEFFALDNNDDILSSLTYDRNLKMIKGELVGMYKISSEFYHLLCADGKAHQDLLKDLDYREYFWRMSLQISDLYLLKSPYVKWYSLIYPADVKYAEKHIAQYC